MYQKFFTNLIIVREICEKICQVKKTVSEVLHSSHNRKTNLLENLSSKKSKTFN